MHWIQDEKPIQHHVFACSHNHGAVKKKLLGGVSLDGGGLGSSGKRTVAGQTGVQSAQPSFPLGLGKGIGSGFGMGRAGVGFGIDKAGSGFGICGIDGINGIGKADGEKGKSGSKLPKDTVHIHQQDKPIPAMPAPDAKMLPNMIPILSHLTLPIQEKKPHAVMGKLGKHFPKMQKGVQAFLQKKEQKAGKEGRRKPPKKDMKGTRAITKEAFYEMRSDTAYLLDSYNKYGERSMLGK